MLGDLDYNLPIPSKNLELALCLPDRTQIAILTEAYNITRTQKIVPCGEITFSIPYYVTHNGKKMINEHFDMIKGDYLILVNNEHYYMIIDPQSKGGDKKDHKEFQAYSLEYELSKKLIREYKHDSRKLYDITNSLDDDGIQMGILNYISTLTTWSVDESSIPADLLIKYRGFDISEKSILDLLKEIQTTFICIFQYDTINKKIYVKNLENIGQNKGLYISEENYLKIISSKMKHDEIVTRLRVYGKDGQSIQSISATGVDYIEDFSFYKNNGFMSDDLVSALNAYEALIIQKTGDELNPQNGTFYFYLNQYNYAQQQYYQLYDAAVVGMTALKLDLVQIQDNLDVATKQNEAQGHNRDYWYQQQIAKEAEIASKQLEIDAKQSELDTIDANMTTLKNSLKRENHFTFDQLMQLDYFIREKTWSDNNIDIPSELYETAKKAFVLLSQPTIEFTIDIIDFMKLTDFQHDWDKLVLGDIINIVYPKFNIDYQVRLVAFTQKIDSNDIKLELSNRNAVDNPLLYLSDLLKTSMSTATSVDMSKFKWDKSTNNENTINKILTNAWDAAKNAVLAGKNQNVIINERGIFLTDKDTPDEQIGMLNNVIAFTRNNWQTASLSITPNGVYAESLYGHVVASEMLNVTNSAGTFLVDELGVTLDGMALTITNGIQENHLSDSVANAYVKLGQFYNNLKFDSIDGITATRSDNTVRTRLNATEGLKFSTSTDNGTTWKDIMYYDILDKHLVVQGVVQAADFQDLQGNSFFTSDKSKIAGGMIESKGIIVRNYSNPTGQQITFAVDSNGDVTLNGGNLTITSGLSDAQILSNGRFETPSGAQSKADTAQSNSNSFTSSKDSTLRSNLNLTAPLPTSLKLDSSGITATTSDPTKFARLDYRGLYIENGAIQIKSTDGTTFVDGSGVKAEYLTGTYITGKTIRTAASGSRIELSGTGLTTYGVNGIYKNGFCLNSGSFSQMKLYKDDTQLGYWGESGGDMWFSGTNAQVILESTTSNLKIRAGSGCGYGYGSVKFYGDVSFLEANVSGFTAVFG